MKREQLTIHTPFIKLDGLLKFCGEASTGGHSKALIEEGAVLVNGEVCLQRGRKIYPGMVVVVEGREIEVVGIAD